MFLTFTLNHGEMIQFDVHIFPDGLVQPPTSYRQVATPEGTMGATDSLNVAMLEAWSASSAKKIG